MTSSCNLTKTSTELTFIYIFKSSAKRAYLQKRNTLFKSLMNNKNNNGDKCPPCGIPDRTLNSDDTWFKMLTCCVFPVKNELNDDKSDPLTPRLLSLFINNL